MHKKNRISFLLFLLLALCLAMPAGAQPQEQEAMILASRLIDRDVYDSNRRLIGEVDDIIIQRTGVIRRITVEFGGFIDIGDKLVALPFRYFNLIPEGVVVEATEEQLEKRPEFNYYREGLRPEYFYRTRAYTEPRYYSSPPYYRRDYRGPSAGGRGPYAYEWAYSPGRYLASVLMNRRLVNENGGNIGRVQDLLIDRKNKKIDKIIISSIDTLDDDVLVALPYKPLGFTSYGLLYEGVPKDLGGYVYSHKENQGQ